MEFFDPSEFATIGADLGANADLSNFVFDPSIFSSDFGTAGSNFSLPGSIGGMLGGIDPTIDANVVGNLPAYGAANIGEFQNTGLLQAGVPATSSFAAPPAIGAGGGGNIWDGLMGVGKDVGTDALKRLAVPGAMALLMGLSGGGKGPGKDQHGSPTVSQPLPEPGPAAQTPITQGLPPVTPQSPLTQPIGYVQPSQGLQRPVKRGSGGYESYAGGFGVS